MPNLDVIYDVTITVTWDEKKKKKQVTGNLSTYLPAKFRHIWFILRPLSMA